MLIVNFRIAMLQKFGQNDTIHKNTPEFIHEELK